MKSYNAGTFYGVQTSFNVGTLMIQTVLNAKTGISVSSLMVPAGCYEDYPVF